MVYSSFVIKIWYSSTIRHNIYRGIVCPTATYNYYSYLNFFRRNHCLFITLISAAYGLISFNVYRTGK